MFHGFFWSACGAYAGVWIWVWVSSRSSESRCLATTQDSHDSIFRLAGDGSATWVLVFLLAWHTLVSCINTLFFLGPVLKRFFLFLFSISFHSTFQLFSRLLRLNPVFFSPGQFYPFFHFLISLLLHDILTGIFEFSYVVMPNRPTWTATPFPSIFFFCYFFPLSEGIFMPLLVLWSQWSFFLESVLHSGPFGACLGPTSQRRVVISSARLVVHDIGGIFPTL